MKPQRSKPIKTEESLEKVQENPRGGKDWVFHSVLKNKKKPVTPIRFADVINKKSHNLQSTNDRVSTTSNKTKQMKSQITEAISILKEQTVSSQKKKYEVIKQQLMQAITPFSLAPQYDGFEEQLSFKGASNRLVLLAKLDSIESEAKHIFSIAKTLNQNSNIDFITFKLLKSKEKDVKLSFYDFYSHLESLAKKISDFVTELTRCREIMTKMGTGISKKTMEFYIDKFEGLIKELKNNVSHLQSYIDVLNRLQKQEKRGLKKQLLSHKCGPPLSEINS